MIGRLGKPDALDGSYAGTCLRFVGIGRGSHHVYGRTPPAWPVGRPASQLGVAGHQACHKESLVGTVKQPFVQQAVNVCCHVQAMSMYVWEWG